MKTCLKKGNSHNRTLSLSLSHIYNNGEAGKKIYESF